MKTLLNDDIPPVKVKFKNKPSITIPHPLSGAILWEVLNTLKYKKRKVISYEEIQNICYSSFLQFCLNFDNVDLTA